MDGDGTKECPYPEGHHLRDVWLHGWMMASEENALYYNEFLDSMPKDRIYFCHEVNPVGIPVAWIEYEDRYGFTLETMNCYGEGSTTSIIFCPFCGEHLQKDEHNQKIIHPIRKDRGIIIEEENE